MRNNQINSANNAPVSQHFLTNKRLLSRIVGLSTICKSDTVLEIGTGKGHLACMLADRCQTLYTIEIDAKLHRQAQRRLEAFPNVRLTRGDFLRSALPKGKLYKVFANIPFCITSQIIRKLTGAVNPPSEMWLVMDKGAAKNYLGKPHENLQSLLLKPQWDMRVVYHFKREDFHPNPSVDSVLVHFVRKQQADILPAQWRSYRQFVERGLAYGLFGNNRPLTKKQAAHTLKAAGFNPDIHNGLLLYVQWLCLFRCWQSK